MLSERGYGVTYRETEEHIPDTVDLATGKIGTRTSKHHLFRVTFERPKIRTDAPSAKSDKTPLELLRTDESQFDAASKMVVGSIKRGGRPLEGAGSGASRGRQR